MFYCTDQIYQGEKLELKAMHELDQSYDQCFLHDELDEAYLTKLVYSNDEKCHKDQGASSHWYLHLVKVKYEQIFIIN